MKNKTKYSQKKTSNLTLFDKSIFVFIFFTTIVFLLYGQTILFDFSLDDNYYLGLLPSIDGTLKDVFTSSFTSIFNSTQYRPITTFTLALESYLFGRTPSVFHFFNVLYYSILIFCIYKLLLHFHFLKKKINIIFICLLFLLHPIHVEVVASIKNREAILSFLFFCVSLNFAIGAIQNKSIPKLLLYFLFLILSMLSKIDCTPLFLSIGALLYFTNNTNKKWHICLSILSIIATITFSNIMESYVFKTASINNYSFVDEGENPLAFATSIFEKIPMSIGTFGYYIKLNLLPTGYYFYYGTNMLEISSFKNIAVIFSFLVLLFLLVYFAYNFYYKKNISILFGITWFCFAIFPFLNLMVTVAGIIAVRYSFPASLGFIIAISSLYYLFYEKLSEKFSLNKYLIWLPLVILLPFTIKEIRQWKNLDTLIESDIVDMQKSVVGNRIAAARYYQIAQEKNYYKKNILLKSLEYCNIGLSNYNKDAELLNLKGKVLISLKRYDEAEQTLKLGMTDSTNLKGINILASLLLKQNKINEAKDLLIYAVKNKKIEEALYQLNDIYIKEDSVENAILINTYSANDKQLLKSSNQLLGDCYLLKADTLLAIHYYEIAFISGYRNKNLAHEIILFLQTKKQDTKATSFKKFELE